MLHVLSIIDGLGFDPFIRGILSVGVGVVVLFGSTYLLVASNSGARIGALIAGGGLFGWMFLMGIFWTAYGIGWVGPAPHWALVEINRGDLALAENERAQQLGIALESISPEDGVNSEDLDIAQVEAVEFSRENLDEFSGWLFLGTSDPIRGEAQSAASEFLASENVYESPSDYLPLRYGTFTIGGKPRLDPAIDADDPDRNAWVETFTDAPARIWLTIRHLTINAVHTEELMLVQVQGVREQPALPGEAPPVAEADEEKPVTSVLMRRDRGGPLPMFFGGLRFTPAMFTIANGLLFGVFCWAMHNRDKREAAIRAGA